MIQTLESNLLIQKKRSKSIDQNKISFKPESFPNKHPIESESKIEDPIQLFISYRI